MVEAVLTYIFTVIAVIIYLINENIRLKKTIKQQNEALDYLSSKLGCYKFMEQLDNRNKE